jgi:hypothetical protein
MAEEDSPQNSFGRTMPFAPLSPQADFNRPLATARPRPIPAPRPLEKKRGPAALAWFAALVAAWVILIGARAGIVKILPGAAPAYAALGMKVNFRQMDVRGVNAKLVEEDGRKILLVEGEIRNIGAAPRTPPRMRLAVDDSTGQEIYFWTAAPPKSRLNPGESAFFRARLAAPPEEGADVRVRFAPDPASAT